jgi:hypothetical protein
MTQIQPIPNKRIVDLTGNRCGRLTIIGFAGIELRGKGSSVGVWWAQCSCGSNPIKVVSGQWNRKHHVSCGCKKKLNSHHIIPISEDKRLYNDPNNIITRCQFCHFTKAHTNTRHVRLKIQKQLQKVIIELSSDIP